MEQVELDVALEELETRLERLRALYEQYFLGLEKIEPAVARKDVDRRIYVLRREKIRNTAKRFKLQTIIQRYNTFQQYWQRICREIENGTYRRHLLRAQKTNGELLTIAARKRLGRAGRTSQPPETASPSQPPSAPPSAPPQPVAEVAPAPPPAAPAPVPASAVAAAAPVAKPAAPKPPPAKPAQKFESLDLDMDFMGDWDPGAARRPAPAAKPAPAPSAKPAPVAAATTPAAARPASIPPPPVAAPPRPASSRPPRAPAHPIVASPRIPPSPRLPPAARPAPSPLAAPPPKPAPSSPTATAPPKPAPSSPTAAAPPKPAAAAAPPKPAAAAAPPKPAAAAPAAAAASGFDDTRLRDLHAKLQQAKQQTKEANVSFEGLAKSIRATEAKLREQHKNRRIDFDVVIKDGRAVVKPIVK